MKHSIRAGFAIIFVCLMAMVYMVCKQLVSGELLHQR